MGDIGKMLAYARSKWHKVKYSMGPKRYGPDFLDCSSFVYYSLIAGGFLGKNHPIGNTETLYKLKERVLKEIYSHSEIRPGDIFIRGVEGYSNGAYGHTGIFLDKNTIIHCNASNNTVTINGANSYISTFIDRKRSYKERYFRPMGGISKKVFKVKNEKWRGRTLAVCNVRTSPSLSARIVARYNKNEVIHYDQVYQADGHRWISYIGNQSKKRRYVAYRDMRGNQWISFK